MVTTLQLIHPYAAVVQITLAALTLASPRPLESQALACLPDGHSRLCFFYYNTNLTWGEAREECSKLEGQLISLTSREREQVIEAEVKKHAGQIDFDSPGFKIWTAGHVSADHEWAWLDHTPLSGDVLQFSSEPKEDQNCGIVESPMPSSSSAQDKPKLNARSCRLQLHFLCQQTQNKGSSGSCMIGSYSGEFVKDRCVVPYGNDPLNFRQGWRKARELCGAINASLASLHDLSREEVLQAISHQQDVFWIALTNQEWVWIDSNDTEDLEGTDLSYSNWYPNPESVPGGGGKRECLGLGVYHRSQIGWTDELCSEKLPFICQINYVDEVTEAENYNASHPVVASQPPAYLNDWANVILPCAMVALIALAALLSLLCHYYQKRKDYDVKK